MALTATSTPAQSLRPLGCRVLSAWTLALALCGSAPSDAAGLRESYYDALESIEQGDWQAAEARLRAALSLRSDPARRLPLKRIFGPYLPHYYLGVALVQQGDCRGALAAWGTSEGAEVIRSTEVWSDLLAQRGACEKHLEELQQLTLETDELLKSASETAAALASPQHAEYLHLGYDAGLGSLRQRLDQGRAQIDEANVQLGQAREAQSTELAATALDVARDTDDLLTETLSDAHRIGELFAADRAERSARLEDVRALAQRVDGLLRSRSPLPPSIRNRRQQLESLLAGARSLPESATIEQIAGLERRLDSYRRMLESSATPPPGALRSGASAFLRADYQEVLTRLEEIPYENEKARGHCLLLRSAAAFALHVAGGSVDLELLQRAREDVAAIKGLLPDLSPGETAFSPRFRRFFESVVPEVEATIE